MKIEDYYIIYNPKSGNGISKKLIKNIKHDLDKINKTYKIVKTEYAKHAIELCKKIDKYRKLIIVGGDGTFNEAINGIMQNQNIKPTIGFIPGGTGNAMMHDLNATSYNTAMSLILNANKKLIDVLKLDFLNKIEYSINIVGWGMAADINILAEKLRFLGSSRYMIASIYYAFKKINRRAKVQIDEHEITDNFLFILNLNTIHTGKGMKAAPNALLDDGLIDIIILKANISRLELLLLLSKIYTGKHIFSNKVEYIQAKRINIFPNKQERLNIDGEIKCTTPVQISIMPKAVEIFSNN